MNLYINCGGRSVISGGYGEFSRGIIVGLSYLKNVKVFIRDDLLKIDSPSAIYNGIVKSGEVYPLSTGRDLIDIECVICALTSIPSVEKLSQFGKKVLITGSPFLGIKKEILDKIFSYNSVFYSGNVDEINFSNVLSFNLPQPIDLSRFSDINPIVSISGLDTVKRFLFVGTFNYWKGVDLAVKAFVKANINQGSELYIKCGISKKIGLSSDEVVNYVKHLELYVSCVVSYINETGFYASFDMSQGYTCEISLFDKVSGSILPKKIFLDFSYSDSKQMKEIYDKSNVLLCTSRGETWSMPVIESLYNGLSVVIGKHIGCSSFISNITDKVFVVDSYKLSFDNYSFSDRSSGGGRAYCGGDVFYFDCVEADLIKCIEKCANLEVEEVSKVRENVEDRFSWDKVGLLYYDALLKVMVSPSI